MTPPGFPNDFPSPTVRHNPCSDPPCQHGTSKRLVGEGLSFVRGDDVLAIMATKIQAELIAYANKWRAAIDKRERAAQGQPEKERRT